MSEQLNEQELVKHIASETNADEQLIKLVLKHEAAFINNAKEDKNGEVEIDGDSAPFWKQSTQSIKYVTGTIKPVTKGNVLLYATTSDGATSTYIGQYAPKDTTPFYRQYRIPALKFDTNVTSRCVLARLRKRFVPITSDNDFLLISNLPAMKNMFQAMYYMEAKDPVSYANYKGAAIDILRKEAKAYVGLECQKPLITVSESPGVRSDGVYIL